MKLIGKRSAGKPHAAFDVAEAGNMICIGCVRQSSTLPVRDWGCNSPGLLDNMHGVHDPTI